MERIFKYLKDEEYKQLLEQAERKKYAEDDVLLKEGDTQTSIFIIVSGTVKVQRDHMMGFAIELSRHGKGEIFGEMSFLDESPASASVVACEAVNALEISHRQIVGMIRDSAGFHGRFYQSLAYILSRRLRETNEKVSGSSESMWSDA